MDTSRFDSLWLRAGGTSDSAMVIINILTDHYSETHRHYHTLGHIENCLRTYDQAALELGTNDGNWVEVLEGLKAGEQYVVKNSFVVKAEIEKSSAVHSH